MTGSPDGPSRPRRTYGRAKAVPSPDDIPNMLFAAPRDSPSKNLLDRFSAKSSNWRESLTVLDAQEKETEDEISAARERFRKAKAGAPSHVLAAFSSSTLTDPPSSTPPANVLEAQTDATWPPPPSSPPSSPSSAASPVPSRSGQPTESTQHPSSAISLNTALEDNGNVTTPRVATPLAPRRSATPTRETRPDPFAGLFDDENEEDESGGTHSSLPQVKGLTKAEMEEARRDAARALRERVPELSKPEPTRRPISAWFEKAQSAATNPVMPRGRLAPNTLSSRATRQPDTSPAEDIRQFPTSQATPRSRTVGWSERRSSADQRAILPSTSSPTPAVRPRRLLEDHEENDEGVTLDALKRETAEEQERKRWALAKQYALKTRKQRQPVGDSDDEDFIIERNVKPASRAGSSIASRQMPRMLGQASNRASKRPVAGRKGCDMPVTHARMTNDLVGRHYEQAQKLQQHREERYGASRRLPEKQDLDLGTIIPASASAEAEGDSDDDDSDFAPEDDDDPNSEVWGGKEDAAAPMSLSEHASEDEGPESEADEDEEKENRPVIADSMSDEEGDGLITLKKRNTKARVAFLSDDEANEPEKPLEEAKRQPLGPTQGNGLSAGGFGADFGGFDGDGDGGFSQLFAETQGMEGFGGEDDAFDKIREQEEAAHRIAPTAALLPSVQISESQRKRDNALIGGEAEELATPKADETKRQYLNSQGFFTQTRPNGLASQQFGSATQLATNKIETSSTLINSSDRPSDPTSPTTAEPDGDDEMTFTRLRRRRSSAHSPNETPTPTGPRITVLSSPERPTRPRNAFDLLNAGAARQKARNKARDSELIDAQAEESDDDAGWGFVAKEAEEDEEEDGFVPELVDDEVLPDDIREAQDALATEKARAMEVEDDARREAEAKKVVEGHYRVKRRGNEFLSDEEEEAGPRMSKKARRQRRIDREDGLFKLGGEANVFLQAYEEDLESDNEFDEAPLSPGIVDSPVMKLNAREREALLKQRARMNTEGAQFRMDDGEEVGGFAIARTTRATVSAEMEDGVTVFATSRSVESYTKFVSEQATNPYRSGGGGVSVVGHGSKPNVPKRTASMASAGANSGRSLGASGSVLLGRGSRFG